MSHAEFLVIQQTTQVTQLPYIPNLAPCDFWLYPKLISPWKGKRFQDVYGIQENMTGQPVAIGRTVCSPSKVTHVSSDFLWGQPPVRETMYIISRICIGGTKRYSVPFWIIFTQPPLKGTEVSLSYVQCFLYLVSSSINSSIFHITWLETYWTHEQTIYMHIYCNICIDHIFIDWHRRWLYIKIIYIKSSLYKYAHIFI